VTTSGVHTPATRDPGVLGGIRVVTFDFGNTLVPVDRAGLRRVVEITGSWVVDHLGARDIETFLAIWGEERERQFREEIPRYREADLAARFVRVLARLRGMAAPPPDVAWDDAVAAVYSDQDEVNRAVDTYSRAFVDALPAPPEIGPLLSRLTNHYTLGILSNWPFAATIDRYADAAGWTPHLTAVVVSQRVGTIKPHPAIFAAALEALGGPDPEACLHVGDDWAADVVGAKRAGWRAAHVRTRPEDSPLPGSEPDDTVVADLELDALTALEPALAATSGQRAADR
jgi:putative hydrolase of the HAD superfamily